MDFEGRCDNDLMSRFCQDARIRVRYAETDQMGVAYYANYLVWMEVGRVECCQALGFRYRDMEMNDGVLLAVVEAHCRYLYPARYDDEMEIAVRYPVPIGAIGKYRYAIFNPAFRIKNNATR